MGFSSLIFRTEIDPVKSKKFPHQKLCVQEKDKNEIFLLIQAGNDKK